MTAVIVSRDGYFSHWVAQYAPRFDGDDDNFVSKPVFTDRPEEAHIYSSPRAARRAIDRIRAQCRRSYFCGCPEMAVVS
jgi:hypothetical protein